MSNQPSVTVAGNLVRDPDIKFTQNGKAVTTFTIASTPRRYDRQTNQWVDGDPLFMRCIIFGKLGENLAEAAHKGTRVIATGRLAANRWTGKDGQNHEIIELHVDDAGVSAMYAHTRQDTQAPTPQGQAGGWGNTGTPQAPQGQGGGWGSPADPTPPF